MGEPPEQGLRALLEWYVDAGADEAIGDAPRNRYAVAEPLPAQAGAAPTAQPEHASAPATPAPPQRPVPSPGEAESSARGVAAACSDLASLRAAFDAFDGCALKKTATQLVFADGNPKADVMLVGEAPGADEDRIGRPFVGAAGKLLDRMLAAIGLDRTSVYIANMLPWRPPGNRKPTPNEIAVCLPFLYRHIELVVPRILVLVGGTSAAALLGTSQGITRIRGRWHVFRGDPSGPPAEIPAMPIFHSAYLLRSPGAKKEAWQDLLKIRRRLDGKD